MVTAADAVELVQKLTMPLNKQKMQLQAAWTWSAVAVL
jgi:hypothetical protein